MSRVMSRKETLEDRLRFFEDAEKNAKLPFKRMWQDRVREIKSELAKLEWLQDKEEARRGRTH